ncbi:hypothetical protein [Geothrix mesophila]|uniref:hypothetical protein n=1 Tax=Geothrix mesophila TaxID=2922723 RepID=UPI001FAE47FA|nr:hypothetical protein [Geothrix sp. SG198]
MPCWLQIAQGLLTPLIAIITTYIAWQQWRATKLKMNLDRYERRLKIYQESHNFIAEINRDVKPELSEMFGFYSATAEADFVFPPLIREYLDELFSHANLLHSANAQYRDIYQPPPPPDYNHKEVCDTIAEHTRWFMEQPKLAKDKFKPFLNISK